MKQSTIPGMDDFFDEEEQFEEFHEGQPNARNNYFDATLLPDAPGYQPNALNNQTYVLYIIFPTWEALKQGVLMLTGGERKSLSGKAKSSTISSHTPHKGSGLPLFQWWAQRLLGVSLEAPAKVEEPAVEDSLDEAQAPI